MSLVRKATDSWGEPCQRKFWPIVTDRIGSVITHYPWREDPDCTEEQPFYYVSDAIHLPTNYQIVVL